MARRRRRSRSRATSCATSTAPTTPSGCFEVDDDRHRASRRRCISGLVLRGLKKPSRLPGVRPRVHAADAARRDDGLGRGRLRRVLPVRPLPTRRRDAERRMRDAILRKARESADAEAAASSRRTPTRSSACARDAGRALRAGGRLLRHGQRRLGLRRAARRRRVPAPDHREAARAAGAGAGRRHRAAHRDRQRHRLLPRVRRAARAAGAAAATSRSASRPRARRPT